MLKGSSESAIVVTAGKPPPGRAVGQDEVAKADAYWARRREFFEWSEFLLGQTHVLRRHPELLPQQAANQPPSTAPARATASWREKEGRRRPWFRLLNPPKQRDACVAVLSAHQDVTTACAFLPGGSRLVSVSLDGAAKVWDVMTGRIVSELESRRSPIASCAVSPGGRWIAAAAGDGVSVWSAASGERRQTSRRDGVPATACAFSPDSRRLAGCYSDRTIAMFDSATLETLRQVAAPSGDAGHCSFSPRDQSLIAATGRSIIRWTSDLPGETTTLREHDQPVALCAITPDQRWVVSAGDRELKLTSVDGAHKRSTKLRAVPAAIACSPEGHWVAFAFANDIEIRDPRQDDGPRYSLRGHSAEVTALRFSPDGRLLASCARDGSIRLWLVERIARSDSMVERKTVTIAAMSLDGARIAAASGSDLMLWERGQATTAVMLPEVPGIVLSCAFSPNGGTLAAGTEAKATRVWRSRASGPALKGHRGPVTACRFSPDAQFLVTGSADHTMRLWNAKSWSYIATLEGHEGAVNAVAFRIGKETSVVSASDDCTIRQWTLAGKETSRLRGHTAPIRACALSPDHRLLATASDDGSARIWKAGSDRTSAVLDHPAPVRSCCFSPNGRWLLSLAADGAVRVWETSGWTLHHLISDEGPAAISPGFTADGEHAITVSGQRVLAWNVERRSVAARFFADGDVKSLRASQAGIVATGTDSSAMYILAVENLGPIALTPWQDASGWGPFKSKPKQFHFGCPVCRQWSTVDASDDRQRSCPGCGSAIQLTGFHIESDWSSIATAWAD
jgi:WD40 repeat protein